MTDRRSHYWSITLFDETDTPLSHPNPDEGPLQFYCYQQEICPTTNKVHYQMYVIFKARIRFSTVKKTLEKVYEFKKYHIEESRGTPQHNINYCQKEESCVAGTYVQWGVPPEVSSQGKRSDLQNIMKKLTDNEQIGNILQEIPQSIKYIGHMEKAKVYLSKPALRDISVEYIHGKPGTGKSRMVYEKIQHYSYYTPLITETQIWFDGYQGEDILWLDDIDISKYPREFILRLLDRYPLKLPIKGGSVNANYTKVYITSNYHFTTIKDPAILRRIHKETLKQNVTHASDLQEHGQHFERDEEREERVACPESTSDPK